MATISSTVIANMALSLLGISEVLAITDNNKKAKTMNLWYEPTRDELIRAAVWTFARARTTLAQLSEAPVFTYDYQYQLPVKPKCLRVLRLVEGYQYVIESDKLLTSYETANIIFLQRVTDPTKFDAQFVKCFAYKLAHDSCFDLTGSLQRVGQLDKRFEHLLNVASSTSAIEHYRTPDYNNSWMNAGRTGVMEDTPPWGYGTVREDVGA